MRKEFARPLAFTATRSNDFSAQQKRQPSPAAFLTDHLSTATAQQASSDASPVPSWLALS